MKERLTEETIAMRAAREFYDGAYVNLGIGIPNLCALFIPADRDVVFQSENGILGYGGLVLEDEIEMAEVGYMDAGTRFIKPRPGMSFFDMDVGFDMIRGGRLDFTVLGAFQVAEKGDFANWTMAGLGSLGIGGSMDLAIGAKRVIITMLHTTRDGRPRVLRQCSYPLTGKGCVDLIITDLAVMEVTADGLLLKEVAPGWTAEEVQALTEPRLRVAGDLREIEL